MDLFTPDNKPKVQPGKKVIASGRGTDTPTIGDVILARLRPFAFAMRTMLKKYGYNISGVKFKTIVVLFFNQFVSKEPIDVSSWNNNVAFKIQLKDKLNADLQDVRNQSNFSDINTVIDKIIESFKDAKIRREILIRQGNEQLISDEDLMQAKAFDIVMKKLEAEARVSNFVTTGEFRKYMWYLVIAIILIYIFK